MQLIYARAIVELFPNWITAFRKLSVVFALSIILASCDDNNASSEDQNSQLPADNRKQTFQSEGGILPKPAGRLSFVREDRGTATAKLTPPGIHKTDEIETQGTASAKLTEEPASVSEDRGTTTAKLTPPGIHKADEVETQGTASAKLTPPGIHKTDEMETQDIASAKLNRNSLVDQGLPKASAAAALASLSMHTSKNGSEKSTRVEVKRLVSCSRPALSQDELRQYLRNDDVFLGSQGLSNEEIREHYFAGSGGMGAVYDDDIYYASEDEMRRIIDGEIETEEIPDSVTNTEASSLQHDIYYVEFASFSSQNTAANFANTLCEQKFTNVLFQETDLNGQTMFIVRSEPILGAKRSIDFLQKVQSSGYSDAFVVR